MVTCTRRLELDYGHRLLKHEGKCKNAHGHRGIVDVTVETPGLDSVGRVVDFGVIKSVLGAWLDANWDHAFICEVGDPLVNFLQTQEPKSRVFILPCPPTAENLVRYFAGEATARLMHLQIPELRITHVRWYETPNAWADYRP